MPTPFIAYLVIAAAYMASVLGLAATLYLFTTVKIELRGIARRACDRLDRLESQMATRVESQAAETVYIPVEPRPGVNLERRAHALRLLRRGEDAAHIAAVLGVPVREVELLIRVQRMVAGATKTEAPITAKSVFTSGGEQ